MNTLANAPVAGLVPELSVKPLASVADLAAGVMPHPGAWTMHWTKDVLVTCYAYGLLGFGLLFPPLLIAWYLLFGAAAQ